MSPEQFKTMVIVKLEMLRGCCSVGTISKKQVGKSIEEFIKKIEAMSITTDGITRDDK